MQTSVVTANGFVHVVDDFYADPTSVRRRALQLAYYEPPWLTGLRSRESYYPAGTRTRLEAALGSTITNWIDDPETGHGIFYKAFGSGRRREVPGIHYDEPTNLVTCLIYLTPGLPVGCGTSLWMHRSTGLLAAPRPADGQRLRRRVSDLRELIERDSRDRGRWIEVDRIGYRYNRLVCYPSRLLHSATKHFGASDGTVRLYQTFRVGLRRR